MMFNAQKSVTALKKVLSYPANLIAQLWQDCPLALKGMFVIILPLTVLLASLASLYLREQETTLLENKLSLALQNQRDIQTVHTQLLEASTGLRDYLLTGDKNFLGIYYRAEKMLPVILQKLEQQLEGEQQKKRLALKQVADGLSQCLNKVVLPSYPIQVN